MNHDRPSPARFVLLPLVCLLLVAACGGVHHGTYGADGGGAVIEWNTLPPDVISAGVAFTATWVISGAQVVNQTDLHACPSDQPDCKNPAAGGPRIDGVVQSGVSGLYTGELTVPAGAWVIYAHSKVDGQEGGLNTSDVPRTVN